MFSKRRGHGDKYSEKEVIRHYPDLMPCCNGDVGDYRIYLFGKKAAKEGIVAAIIALTEIDVSEENELPKYICCSCAGKISNLKNKVDEFKKVCQDSATKQREELEFGNVKGGRNDETVHKSPSVVIAPKKTRTSDSRTSRSLQGSSQSIAPKPWTFNTIPNALLSSNCPRPNWFRHS